LRVNVIGQQTKDDKNVGPTPIQNQSDLYIYKVQSQKKEYTVIDWFVYR